MLNALPKGWFSWDFSLHDSSGGVVGDVLLSSWREQGAITIRGGPRYTVRRQGILGPFVLEAPDGSGAASAVKPSVLRREFNVEHGGRLYALRAVSALRRQCLVLCEDRPLGRVSPDSWFSRRARLEIADDVPLVLQAFLVWLTLLMWKRDSDGGAAAAASA